MHIANRKAISRTLAAVVIIVILVIAIGAAIVVLHPWTSSPSKSGYKLALVIGGDETDVGLNANGVAVAEWIHSTYGWTVSISRDVAYSDQATVITTYAQENYTVVWTDGNQFIGTTEYIAKQFPHVLFIMSPTYDGDNLTSNVVAVGAGYQATGYYLAGVLAGKMTKTNATGVIIGQWFAALSFEFYAYWAGVNSTNPSHPPKVYLTVPGTWADPSIGYTDAQTMISTDHVDILVPIADATGRGAIAAAMVENISIIGTVEDQVTLAPNNMMTSVLLNTTAFIQPVIQRILNGTWSAIGGRVIDMNLGSLAPYHYYDSIIPTSVKTLVNETAQGIDNGTIHVPFIYTSSPPSIP
jgi:basic membrane lipoprotein Med (substrate-binding protein (PBP1-ABC) superfamily)